MRLMGSGRWWRGRGGERVVLKKGCRVGMWRAGGALKGVRGGGGGRVF